VFLAANHSVTMLKTLGTTLCTTQGQEDLSEKQSQLIDTPTMKMKQTLIKKITLKNTVALDK
jgi:hypothetical protein